MIDTFKKKGAIRMATFIDYMNALKSHTIHPIARLYFLNSDGTPYREITEDFIVGGSISVSANDGVRRTASVTLSNEDGQYDELIQRGVLLTQKVKLYAGLRFENGDEYLIPQGVFYINNPVSSYQPASKTLQLNLIDKWSALDGTVTGTLDGIYQINVDDSLLQAISAILQLDRGDGQPFDNVSPLIDPIYLQNESLYKAPYTLRTEANSTYANILLGINTMLVSSCGYDAEGILRFRDANTTYKEINQPLAYDFFVNSRELHSASYTYNLSDIYNEVKVVGTILEGAQIQGSAVNNSPASAIAVDKIGRRTFWVNDTKFYTNTQAREYAEYELNRKTALQRSVTFECSPIYHLKENDLITITRSDIDKSGVPEIFIVNSFTLPFGSQGNMSVNAVSINELLI